MVCWNLRSSQPRVRVGPAEASRQLVAYVGGCWDEGDGDTTIHRSPWDDGSLRCQRQLLIVCQAIAAQPRGRVFLPPPWALGDTVREGQPKISKKLVARRRCTHRRAAVLRKANLEEFTRALLHIQQHHCFASARAEKVEKYNCRQQAQAASMQ